MFGLEGTSGITEPWGSGTAAVEGTQSSFPLTSFQHRVLKPLSHSGSFRVLSFDIQTRHWDVNLLVAQQCDAAQGQHCDGRHQKCPSLEESPPWLCFPLRRAAYLSRVGVGFLRVDAAVVYDVLEGVGHEAPAAALVAVHRGAIHQVLGAQRHQLPCFQLHLSLEGSHSTERPARPAGALQEPALVLSAAFGPTGREGMGRELPTWFFTSVTQPFSLQSTASGAPPRRWYLEVLLCPEGTRSPVRSAATSSLVWEEKQRVVMSLPLSGLTERLGAELPSRCGSSGFGGRPVAFSLNGYVGV